MTLNPRKLFGVKWLSILIPTWALIYLRKPKQKP